MTASQPPAQCDRCAGHGWIWALQPNGEWKVTGRCPECGGTGRPRPEAPKGDAES